MPHDAALVLDTADVDLVIVDAAAGAPGGPWAYLGVPGVPDRERALLALMEVARGRGRPVVLLGTRLAWPGWAGTRRSKAGTAAGRRRCPGCAPGSASTTHLLKGNRVRALVYGDVDLNIIDGSAIWAQAMVQALHEAGVEVTFVLKAPVRTGRLVDPLAAAAGRHGPPAARGRHGVADGRGGRAAAHRARRRRAVRPRGRARPAARGARDRRRRWPGGCGPTSPTCRRTSPS